MWLLIEIIAERLGVLQYPVQEAELLHQRERSIPGATTALLHRDRPWPRRLGYVVMADSECRLMEIRGRVCVWSTASSPNCGWQVVA